ncbi:hypothetical protein HHE02_06220 [Helicobacter heilmannii]|uniref:Uncharacterized protein n=1 Tax=Helicobacter heilmannii TaxID=35817 RepID=A0A0K2XP01_HELHE|nr:hypothetical protein BN341_5130 [Helicobacter heilmannii ASB1.4]CRF45716.1 hypothetical protein HHE014_06870 [Helicobacter heilmannii]CRF47334.1 hypothetical protein HHE02_06220 [Helicobacter heilmannii]CRF48703.1 hypothetical protein HHE03_02770 [Helicobacter heilmannii]CRF51601.1 hypothetical protein HHE06_14890 [Helicobacter heilmannii]
MAIKDARAYKNLASALKSQGWQVCQHMTYFQILLTLALKQCQ